MSPHNAAISKVADSSNCFIRLQNGRWVELEKMIQMD